MTTGRRIVVRDTVAYVGFILLLLAGLSTGSWVTLAQTPLQYPSGSTITKDGTAVLLEDYASVPVSTLVRGGSYPAKIDYKGQLGRENALRSEPADVPTSASRFFVPDDNGVLY